MVGDMSVGRKIILAIACMAFTNAEAAVFTFFQDGFEGGGVVTGTFVGEDLNGDGIINTFDSETEGMSVEWSGNALIPGFSVPSNTSIGFVYILSLGQFQNTEFFPPASGPLDFSGTGGGISVIDQNTWIAGEAFLFFGLVSGYGSSQGAVQTSLSSGDLIFTLTNNPAIVTQVVPIPPAWVLLLPVASLFRLSSKQKNQGAG